MPVFDNHGRPITYLRLAVTDRCNLRCFYCMPEDGIKYLPKKQLLSYEEMERLVRVLASMGIKKVRITGGEPFVRHDLVPFMYRLAAIDGVEEIALTTNGILTGQYIHDLKAIGVKSINLSMDTLDRQRFFEITRRDEFVKVERCMYELLDSGFEVKINAVVMEGKNTQDILPMVALTRDYPVAVRFIEEMPFNGEGSHYPQLHWTYRRILDEIRSQYPELQKLTDEPHSTSYNYRVPQHQGTIGVIAAFTRSFCGSCNRIRITAQGVLKTCLYDNGVLQLRDLLRTNISDEGLQDVLQQTLQRRPKDGYEAESLRGSLVTESMTTIGG
ncbi:MAG: GTP 3',8-cyclase MoaA [Spirosomataceae bacterium]